MSSFILHKLSKPKQYLIGISLVLSVGAICFALSSIIDYKIVALILLAIVSLTAMFFDIFPVLTIALLSALIWDFFFIPPKFTFAIGDTEDILMFFMYFIIALVNAVLTYKVRQIEKLSRKKEEKENTLKLYNTLLNSLSHELRTPISTIIAATDNLQEGKEKLSNDNKLELINEISKASLRLNHQVENLLNMSRIESGFLNLKKDWCDINELIYDSINRVKEDNNSHSIGVVIADNLPLFKIDFGLIEHVLYNLIYNATLYIPKYCTITIKAMCKENYLILVVEDNGDGFPEDELDNVFDKFYRLKNSRTGGTGLGLSIVKGFVEAHDGKIMLENIEGGGARFSIAIPCETTYLNNLKNE
jgi:two-component system, OmpR family, sensor histidine kinase KdpD